MKGANSPKIVEFLKSSGFGAAVLGLSDTLRGISYSGPVFINLERPPAHWLENLLPPNYWACVWLFSGLVCFIAIFLREVLPVAVGITVGLHAAWGLSFTFEWLTGDSTRGWVTSILYFTVALIAMWAFGRGRSTEVHLTMDNGQPPERGKNG